MNTNDNRQSAHNMIDHIFHGLLPTRGMAERPEQISLSHLMLDAMADGSIALCDAGTGIGKTYSYLAAGAAFLRLRADSGRKLRPILVSTSSIALQNAVQREYLPLLSDVLMANGLLDQPLSAVIRKGKAHYVCDVRLERRLGQLNLSKKNWKAGKALLSLREQLDMDGVSHFSSYDRNRVCVTRLLIAPTRNLHIIRKQLHDLLSASTHKQMRKLTATMELFTSENAEVVFYAMEDKRGGTMLCAVPADLNAQPRSTLWSQENSVVLTSGTLAVGQDFRRFKEEAGLLADGRVIESVAASPFDYKASCLLYLPLHPPEQTTSGYYDELAAEIAALLDACWGHALVLFTSYAAISAIKERLAEMKLPWEIFTLGRNAVHTTQQFKDAPGSVLLATGAAWEGFDFPGDCVSLLVIPRLPFSRPDALKEKKRAEYPSSVPISGPWWCRRCRSS